MKRLLFIIFCVTNLLTQGQVINGYAKVTAFGDKVISQGFIVK